MLKDILEKASSVTIIKNSQRIENIDIQEQLNTLLEGAYFTPSYVIADNEQVVKAMNAGVWLEFDFGKELKYNDYNFSKLAISVKPKYDFLNFFRFTTDKFEGKCIGIKLSNKTTELYDYIVNYKEVGNEE